MIFWLKESFIVGVLCVLGDIEKQEPMEMSESFQHMEGGLEMGWRCNYGKRELWAHINKFRTGKRPSFLNSLF